MYLRRINHKQTDGNRRFYWALVESYRTERGPRQRVVAYIGESDEAVRLGIKQAAEGKDYYQGRLFYDVTSTYFEGAAEENPKAQRGYSRDSRGDCKQVCIGLVVTKEGMPIGYEVFEGNKHDSKTVEEIIDKMEKAYGKTDRIWIMDRGMISKGNMEILKAEGRRYIIGTPKSQLKKFEQELLKGDWQKVYEGLEVKLCKDQGEVFILCRSSMRKEKDKGITERFIERIQEGLEKYQKQSKAGRIKNKNIDRK